MRPDQHKKKRSAQYQKKHGMTKSSEKNSSQGDTKTGRGKRDGGNQRDATSSVSSQPAASAGVNGGASGRPSGRTDIDDEQQLNIVGMVAATGQKSYSRRKVISNWERYEGLDLSSAADEDAGITIRGADFQAVLDSANNALAHFRFKEELTWDVDDAGKDPSGGQSDFMAVDFADLAASLNCIPLHKRLNIEEEAFGGELLELFEHEARKNMTAYQPLNRCKSKLPRTDGVNPLVVEKLDDFAQNPADIISDVSLSQAIRKNQSTNVRNEIEEDILGEILQTGNVTSNPVRENDMQDVQHRTESVAPGPTPQVHAGTDKPTGDVYNKDNQCGIDQQLQVQSSKNDEDELDFLLSLDDPVRQIDSTASSHTTEATTEVEDPVEKTEHKVSSESSKKTLESSTKSDQSNKLEDWLDDLLDD